MVNAPEVEQQESKQNGVHASNGTNGDASSVNTPEVTLETATDLLNKGKRNLICDNIAQAVTELSQSCAQFDKVFGEGDIKCAKSYFWYGSALLEMARLENGVLGNALQGTPAEESASANNADGEDKEKPEAEAKPEETGEAETSEEQPVAEVSNGQNGDHVNSTNGDTVQAKNETSNEADKVEEEEADKENDEEEATAADDEEEEMDTKGMAQLEESIGGEEEEDEDDDDDDDSLKLSWQMVDWARKLLETTTEEEVEGRDDLLAQCFLKLGENLMEAAHHAEADVEFKKCIDIYQACYAQVQANPNMTPSKNSNKNLIERSMAEAYFVAGLNLINGKNYTNASNHFESAISVIKKRLASLQTKLEKLDEDEKEECSLEMVELKDILPNIEEKLAEAKLCSTQEVANEANDSASCSGSGVSALQQAFKEVEEIESRASESNGAKSEIDSAPAKDISHLVKRKSPLKQKANGLEHREDGASKRKADPEGDDSVTKKQKVEEVPESESNCAA